RFVNADLIAAGLSPFAPEKERIAAGRLFLKEVAAAERADASFGFETTLAGQGYLRLIDRLQGEGWRVERVYRALPAAETAKARVAERVANGGHHIPDDDVQRRFHRSLDNLFGVYAQQVDRCLCLLNIGSEPQLIVGQARGHRETHRQDILDR